MVQGLGHGRARELRECLKEKLVLKGLENHKKTAGVGNVLK